MRVNDIELHVEDHGSGRPVVLLHGFPDSSALWRHQFPALAAAGYRTIAPDLRGFGASDRPEGVEHYRLQNVVMDVVAMMDALDVERADVVGHDWGAGTAWLLAALAPDRVRSLTALSVGHPAAWREPSMRQREMSWYMLFFQFEGVAEAWMPHDDWRLFRRFMRGAPDTERAVKNLARPGALTAALNWYRANVRPRPPGEGPGLPAVRVPTMGIWSAGDAYCDEEQMVASASHVEGETWRYERIEDAGHWIPLEAPERLNALLLDWLGARS